MMNNYDQQFQQIIEQHKGILHKIAKNYCKNQEDRQDLLQEMMIQIWQSQHRYNDTYAITTWIYRIAFNVAISFYRKNAKRQRLNVSLIEEIEVLTDETGSEKQQHLSLLENFISELNDLDKAIMLLYLEDKSHAEIAVIIGLSVSNVGTKIGRIKEKLKKKFSQLNSQ